MNQNTPKVFTNGFLNNVSIGPGKFGANKWAYNTTKIVIHSLGLNILLSSNKKKEIHCDEVTQTDYYLNSSTNCKTFGTNVLISSRRSLY